MEVGHAGHIPFGDINVKRRGSVEHFKTTKDKEKGKKKNVRVPIEEDLSFQKKKTKEKTKRETHFGKRRWHWTHPNWRYQC